jgi:hypothetical protein
VPRAGFSMVFAPDWAGPSTQPPASTGIGYLADPIIIEFVFGMMIALVYRAGGRLSMWATMSLIFVGIIWLAVTSPSLPRPYSARRSINCGRNVSVVDA